MSLFYKPDDGWAADCIPFYWHGEYHLFYLKDYRDEAAHGEGTPWFHLSTQDFVNFIDHGEALPRGSRNEQDLYVYTGCVIENEGLFHIYYTGHNPYFKAAGRAEEAVMHATSPDLLRWTKDPDNPILYADVERYEMHDWRDPFVFWNEDAHEYWMLLAARLREGPYNRRGCTAVAASADLKTWQIRQPFWTPNLYYTHECPDLFRIGEWWYFVYSTFSERMLTHYRMSRSLGGPWTAPLNDSFDGRAFYAGKTVSDGGRRFVIGWNPTRIANGRLRFALGWNPVAAEGRDEGDWQWGGNLVVHDVMQEADGTLSVRILPEINSVFTKQARISLAPQMGRWSVREDSFAAHVPDSFAWCRLGTMPAACSLEAMVTFSEQTRSCGIIMRADEALGEYYQVRLEPGQHRVVFDRWPRPGDEPFVLERPITLISGEPVHLQILIEGSVIVAYVNDRIALSTRGYDRMEGAWGVFVSEGTATFREVAVKKP